MSNGIPSLAGADPRTADPMSVFLQRHRHDCHRPLGQKRFNSGEHVWLGCEGARLAIERVRRSAGVMVEPDLLDAIARQDGRETLRYGELVALSGDFYDSPQALFEEKPSPLPWLWESNDLSGLRDIFRTELDWIERRLAQVRPDVPYPAANLQMAWHAKSYVELALRNVDHFGWHNVRAYVRHHGQAMRLAMDSRSPDDDSLRRAIFTNAFADHFLTDGFAAGHIRIPRAEICDWARQRGWNDSIAGALSKLLHDQDGHADLDSLHGGASEDHRREGSGLRVSNALGEEWETYCDGQLFLERSEASPAVRHAVEAVADSVCELLIAWKHREIPEGLHAATRRVPFPHPGVPALSAKFPADLPQPDFDRLWGSVDWYAKAFGLQRKHLHELFEALPSLMQAFRTHVAEQAGEADMACIAPAYVHAFRDIA